jgi:hypothetical protein
MILLLFTFPTAATDELYHPSDQRKKDDEDAIWLLLLQGRVWFL